MVHMKTNHYKCQFLSGMLRACMVKIGNKVQFCHRIGFSDLSLEFLDENNTNARQHIVNKLDQEVVNNFDQFIIKRSGSKRKPTSKGKVAKHQFLNQMFSIAQE